MGSFLLLAVPAYAGLSVPVTYDLVGELSADRASVRGTQTAGAVLPGGRDRPDHRAGLRSRRQFDDDGRPAAASRCLTKELWRPDLHRQPGRRDPADPQRPQPDESAGRSAGQLLALHAGRPAEDGRPEASPGQGHVPLRRPPATRAGHPLRPRSASTTRSRKESIRLLGQIEQRLLALAADPDSPWHGTSFDFTGITAGIRDLEAVNTSDYFRIGALVSIAVLGVLVVRCSAAR